MMMKFCMLVIVSMIMLGLVAGMVSGDAVTGAQTGDIDAKDQGKGFESSPIGAESEQPSEPASQQPTQTSDTLSGGSGGDIVNGPEFSTFGIAAAGALGALSYFFVRRNKK